METILKYIGYLTSFCFVLYLNHQIYSFHYLPWNHWVFMETILKYIGSHIFLYLNHQIYSFHYLPWNHWVSMETILRYIGSHIFLLLLVSKPSNIELSLSSMESLGVYGNYLEIHWLSHIFLPLFVFKPSNIEFSLSSLESFGRLTSLWLLFMSNSSNKQFPISPISSA